MTIYKNVMVMIMVKYDVHKEYGIKIKYDRTKN